MIIFPNCKINLGLSITEKRKDGFHNLETVLYPLQIKDILEIIPSKKEFQFSVSGIELPCDPEQNLVVKAYRLIQKEHGIGAVQAHLHKMIPSGAGLGGGSSDAAHAIILLNKLFSLELPLETMKLYASQLGSDCAFFLNNKPMLAYEKGDLFKPIDLDLESYRILVVKPERSINTPEAYSWVNPVRKEKSLVEIINRPVTAWEGNLINDFEAPVFKRHPELSGIKDRIRSMGALYTSLTGSGAAMYGIFRNSELRESRPEFPGCFVWVSS